MQSEMRRCATLGLAGKAGNADGQFNQPNDAGGPNTRAAPSQPARHQAAH